MGNLEIRVAEFPRDDNMQHDTCVKCSTRCVHAYLTAAIVKIPLCPTCLEEFVGEANAVLAAVKRSCYYCRNRTYDIEGDPHCALTQKYVEPGETCDKFDPRPESAQ